MSSKLFFVACEASADAHGAHLIAELRQIDPSIEFKGVGGPRMQSAGMELREDMTRISALGFGDVIRQYFLYRRIFYSTIASIDSWKPDAVLVIDSPAFNLRLAKKISSRFPIIYYISPQIWAWAARRIHTIKRHIKKMLVILPFEVTMYENAGVNCEFVGHPLLDQVKLTQPRDASRKALTLEDHETGIGLFAGSRRSEVQRIFPVMLESAALLHKKMPGARFFYSCSPNVDPNLYKECLAPYSDLPIHCPEMRFHDLTGAMDFALVTSGTATLETALLGTPFFLLYKTGWSTYFLGRNLIKVPFLGLVNLLAEKRVVPEFIQQNARPLTIAHEAEVLLKNPDLYASMKQDFQEVRKKLGSEGASRRTAEAVAAFLKENARH